LVYWYLAAPAILLAILSLRGERKRAAYVERRLAERPKDLPPASVIVPVKGPEEGLRENLGALASLDYPDYELIVCARSAADIAPSVLPARVKVVLAAGDDGPSGSGNDGTSEKIHNLRAGLRAVRKTSRIVAFADSDGRPTPRWLRALAAPLDEPRVGASTGFRWFTPVPATFWSLMRAVWDAVSAGRLGPGDNPFVWGGAMAIRKDLFYEIRVLDYWKGAVSDDCELARAVHDAGFAIAYAPGALTPCFQGTAAREFFSWARRQLTIIRVYRPGLWWPALGAHLIYCAGMAAAAIGSIQGNRLAEWALIALLSPGMLKGLNRAIIAKAALPEQEAWFRRHSWVHAIWTPLATWIWLIVLGLSACGNTIRWRGNRYYLKRTAPESAAEHGAKNQKLIVKSSTSLPNLSSAPRATKAGPTVQADHARETDPEVPERAGAPEPPGARPDAAPNWCGNPEKGN